MARHSNPVIPLSIDEAFGLGLEFLSARRAQNLSWMRMVEQSLRTVADVQRSLGAGGDSLARLWTAQAGVVRDTAKVYGLATGHLVR